MNPIFITIITLLAASLSWKPVLKKWRFALYAIASLSLILWPLYPGHTTMTWVGRGGRVLFELGLVYHDGSEALAFAACLLSFQASKKSPISAPIIGALVICGFMSPNPIQTGLAWLSIVPLWRTTESMQSEGRLLVHLLSVGTLILAAMTMGVSLRGFDWETHASSDAVALAIVCVLVGVSALLRMDLFYTSKKSFNAIDSLVILSGWGLLYTFETFLSEWQNWSVYYGWLAALAILFAAVNGLRPGRIKRAWVSALLLCYPGPIGIASACLGIGIITLINRPRIHAALICSWIAFHIDMNTDLLIAALTAICLIALFKKPKISKIVVRQGSLLRGRTKTLEATLRYSRILGMSLCCIWISSLVLRILLGAN